MVWDPSTGEQLCQLKGHTSDNEDCRCEFYSDGSGPKNVNPDCPARGHTDEVKSVCFSPCGEKIASGGGNEYGNKDYSIRIWDAKTGEQIGSPLTGHSEEVSFVCFSPDGTKIASGSEDATVLVWDAASGEQLCSLRGHRYAPSLSKECFLSFG